MNGSEWSPEDFEAWSRIKTKPLPPPPPPALVFDPLPDLTDLQRDALAREAQRVNERYLVEFVEEYGFCPFAKKGRRLGQIYRYVHFAETESVATLVALMQKIAADPAQVVVQVVLPMIDVAPDAWRRFVSDLTDFANLPLARDDRMGCAALHPLMPYSDLNPFSMLTLFRRSPDATIQWVRLDAVRALYAGRSGGTQLMTLAEADEWLKRPPMTPLYDRIAITNARMARRLRLETIERLLAGYAADATDRYHRVLLNPAYDGVAGPDDAKEQR